MHRWEAGERHTRTESGTAGKEALSSFSPLIIPAVDYSYGMSVPPAVALTQTHKLQCKYK